MKEYKLFNTDGKTFFDFRSDPKSRCEGFTLSFLDDGTVVMSGDYGTLCWKRNYHHERDKEFHRDYGFPGKNETEETNIGYFAEKVCQFCVEQKIEEWNKEKAIADFKDGMKDVLKNGSKEEKEKLNDAIEQMEWLEEWEDQKFNEIVNDLDDYDLWESRLGIRYTDDFKFRFNILKSVSGQIWDAVNKEKQKWK